MTQLIQLVLLLFVLLTAQVGRAEQSIDVASELRGVRLGTTMQVLEDKSWHLTIEDVSSPKLSSQFKHTTSEAPNFGYLDSAYWVKLVVENSGASSRPWLLEVAYPLLDDLTLYIPQADGTYTKRETGDMRPFSQRDIVFRNFVFSLQEPPHAKRVYYLRAKTTGAMMLPLAAWTRKQFVEHQYLDWSALCVFYGALLVMAAYNLCLYFFARAPEYFWSAVAALTIGLFQFSYVGHTFQFIFPNNPQWAHYVIPISLLLTYDAVSAIALSISAYKDARRLHIAASVLMPTALLIAVCVPWLSYKHGIRAAIGFCVVGIIAYGIGHVGLLLRGHKESRLFFAAWASMLVMAMVTVLRNVGTLPSFWLTDWSLQIGAAFMFVLISSGLAQKINIMRKDLSRLNRQLESKVHQLEEALGKAAEATLRIQAATRVKSEFMATMTHELRTPLNAIINIPQGLIEQFPVTRYAVCSRCKSTFELDKGERISLVAHCPECETSGSLREKQVARYTGSPEHTSRYIQKIVRSGRHLLQVVNDILESGKASSAYMKVSPERVELFGLVRGVLEEMSDLAEHSGVRLRLVSATQQAVLSADPLRLRQVLMNLVGNAIKFSDGRGEVQVRLSEEKDWFQLAVCDEGIGIAKEELETIFRSYEQSERQSTRKFGGTGLGLSVARSLVRLHGGDMWVESELGKGSTFYFRLPKVAKRKSGEVPRPASAA